MLALLAAIVLAPLLYIPGYLIATALLGAAQPPDQLERHYERVLAGALLNGWLALVLAEFGIFSAALHIALIALLCAACAAIAWRRGALQWPRVPLGIVSRADLLGRTAKRRGEAGASAFVLRGSWLARHWETIGFVAVGLLFAVLVARPFEVVLGARDAGVYATTGFAIARNGGIVQYDPLLQQIAQDQQSADPQLRAAAEQAETNLLGVQSDQRFVATRMRLAGYLVNQGDLSQGRVTAQFLHLYPAWIALLASMLGLRGGLLATGLLGLLGLWGVGLLGRRLAGSWVGLLGMLFLALNGVQVWFSRYSTSEACAQFLSFGALYAFAVFQEPRTENQEPLGDKAGARFSVLGSRRAFVGLLAGLAAGQLALTRIDFFVLVAPLLAYLAYIALTKRWARAHWALAGGLLAMLVHAALHIVFISRAYFLDTLYARLQDQSAIVAQIAYWLWTPALRQQFLWIPRSAPLRAPYRLPLEILLLVALLVVFLLLRRDGRPQAWLERLIFRWRGALLGLSAVVILLVGAYAYVIRPQILTAQRLAAAPGCLLSGAARGTPDCLALQGYVGAPVELARQPNAIAYGLSVLPKLIRPAQVAPVVRSLPAAANADIRDVPGGGNIIGRVAAGDVLQFRASSESDAAFLIRTADGALGWVEPRSLSFNQPFPAAFPRTTGSANSISVGATSSMTATLNYAVPLTQLPTGGQQLGQAASGSVARVVARSIEHLGYLITDARGVTGWVAPAALGDAPQAFDDLPIQPNNVVDKVANPRSATTYSFGNPGDSEKIGIAQANLVRVGWYLSPLGVVLGIMGFALWWLRGMSRAAWLFLAASLISTFFFIRLSYGASDLTYIYILRRYMPLTYPAFSLGMAYALVELARRPTTNNRQPTTGERSWRGVVGRRWSVVLSVSLVLAQLAFFVVTNRQLYRHVEYAGALDQLEAVAQRFEPGDVLLFRGEARDTPDLVTTPLQFGFGLDTFAIRSADPGKYAADLARYVQHWRDQGRQVYLVLGANGAVELPGLRAVRVGPMSLRLPEFQQLRDQKPSLPQEFAFDFMIYRLEPDAGAPEAPQIVAPDDYAAQVGGFYHTEQIGGATLAWTDGAALLRLRWPRDGAPLDLAIDLAPGATRPQQLGPAHVCVSYRPETSLSLVDAPFSGEQCFDLTSSTMASYHFVIDPRGQPAPPTGTFLLRIASPTWSPAAFDATQHDARQLGVLFGGIR